MSITFAPEYAGCSISFQTEDGITHSSGAGANFAARAKHLQLGKRYQTIVTRHGANEVSMSAAKATLTED
ncbi:hypothetical protein H6G27_26520 [Nostoc linckia FACHB-104]|nr:hypothetical protein [Nostoc linckia FACHB-104]